MDNVEIAGPADGPKANAAAMDHGVALEESDFFGLLGRAVDSTFSGEHRLAWAVSAIEYWTPVGEHLACH